MQWHKDILRLEDYSDKMQRQMFCFGSDEPAGDEPDGVTFSGGKAGEGVKLSSDNVSAGDTYRGQNTRNYDDSVQRMARGVGLPSNRVAPSTASDDSDALAQIAAAGGNTFSAPAAARAQAMAAPRANATLTATSSDGSTVTRGLPPQLSLAGELINRNAEMGTPVYNGGYGDPVGMVRQAVFPARNLEATRAMSDAGGQVFYDETTGTYKEGTGQSLMEKAAQEAMGYDEAPMIAMPQMGNSDQAQYDNIMASREGINRDSEVVSALSDSFLDARGRQDLDNLAGEAIDYFNSPINQMIDSAPIGGLLSSMTGNPSLTRTKAGLPAGRIGDMQIAVQQGGRAQYGDDGSVAFVTMPDGTKVGEENTPDFAADEGQPVPPQTNPMTGEQRCPQGYAFDANVGACMPVTKATNAPVTAFPQNPDMYVRQTALDTSPANVPTGFDYNAANKAFQQSYAYRPQYYNRSPMDLTGFTKIS